MTMLFVSVIMFIMQLRSNEIKLRSFLKAKDKSDKLGYLVKILKYLPDGILMTDLEKPLYINMKAKQFLHIEDSYNDI